MQINENSVQFYNFYIFSLWFHSQEIYVLDEVTMEPISGALLYEELNGGVKKGTMSDINGAVSLSAFENANFITISHISYLNRTLEFSNITGNILLKPDSNNLDEIVISASKFSQNLKEISQRVIFISSEDVVLSNPQTSADLSK